MVTKSFQITSFIISFGVGLFWLVGHPVFAQAQTITGSLQVEPTFQELAISDEQASVSGSLKLTNNSETAQSFELFAVDIKQFDSEGRVVLADKPLSGVNYSLADFIQTGQTSWTIPAGQSVQIPFTVKNAPKLSPGGHYAALISRLKTTDASTQQVLPAVSSFILVRKIGGELYHLSLADSDKVLPSFWWQVPEKLDLTFSNQGNIHVTPRGLLQLKTLWGKSVFSAVINEDSLYLFPGTQRPISVYPRRVGWPWPVMLYNVVIDARSDPGNVPVKLQSMVLVVHPLAPVGLGLMVAMIITGGFLRKRTLLKRAKHEK